MVIMINALIQDCVSSFKHLHLVKQKFSILLRQSALMIAVFTVKSHGSEKLRFFYSFGTFLSGLLQPQVVSIRNFSIFIRNRLLTMIFGIRAPTYMFPCVQTLPIVIKVRMFVNFVAKSCFLFWRRVCYWLSPYCC